MLMMTTVNTADSQICTHTISSDKQATFSSRNTKEHDSVYYKTTVMYAHK